MARERMYGSAMDCISTAVCTRTGMPFCSQTSATARQFITVASMPMWSARVRSILPPAFLAPRQKLPPPMTMPTWTPMSTHSLMTSQTWPMTSKSRPVPLSPDRASPLIFSSTRLYTG